MRLRKEAQIHKRREVRSEVAEIATNRILQYLNAGMTERIPEFGRVESFIQLVKEADRLRYQLRSATSEWVMHSLVKRDGRVKYQSDAPAFLCRYRFQDESIQALKNQYDRVLQQLHWVTSHYRWTPAVRSNDFMFLSRIDLWAGDLAELTMMPTPFDIARHVPPEDGSPESLTDERTSEKLPPQDLQSWLWGWENWSVHWLFGHVEKQIMDRFRRCNSCNSWFYAGTDRQAFCSETCRKKHFSRSTEFKEKRRKYMIKYRRDERKREERARDAAKTQVSATSRSSKDRSAR